VAALVAGVPLAVGTAAAMTMPAHADGPRTVTVCKRAFATVISSPNLAHAGIRVCGVDRPSGPAALVHPDCPSKVAMRAARTCGTADRAGKSQRMLREQTGIRDVPSLARTR
jgi:hypothetical protein